MNHPSVLIVAQDPAVARDIVSRWQSQPSVPTFTLLSSDFPRIEGLGRFDLAIIHAENGEARNWEDAVKRMSSIVLHIAAKSPNGNGNGALYVPRTGDWVNTIVLLGTEMLKRVQLIQRLSALEGSFAASGREASLGQYMLESRHAFNNALTSVLGNAELLMLNVDRVPEDMREQVETVNTMALKLYEMMQRFASLESEMRFEEKGTARQSSSRRSAAYGS